MRSVAWGHSGVCWAHSSCVGPFDCTTTVVDGDVQVTARFRGVRNCAFVTSSVRAMGIAFQDTGSMLAMLTQVVTRSDVNGAHFESCDDYTSTVGAASVGLATADALCAAEAEGARLTGEFRALLAVDGASAISRFYLAGLPWVRTDGAALGPTAADLLRAALAPINTTANGDYLDVIAWTGASNVDEEGAATCDSWTNTSGAMSKSKLVSKRSDHTPAYALDHILATGRSMKGDDDSDCVVVIQSRVHCVACNAGRNRRRRGSDD